MGSTKTQETKLPQWQEDFIRQNILPKGLDVAGTEYTPYEGELIAGMTPMQMQALSGFGSLNTGQNAFATAQDTQRALTGFAPTAMASQGAVGVDTISAANLDPYMNPYVEGVIQAGQADIERQRQMASNTLGAEATAAGAFGGSRQGVAEGVLAGEAARAAANLSNTQRSQAYDQALASSRFDIANTQAAREAAAARAQSTAATNYAGQFTGAGVQSGAANALGALAGAGLQSEITGLSAQMTAAEQQRALEQAQLQADYTMFQEQQAYPMTQLNALLAAGAGIPTGLGTVTQHDPFGGLTAVGSLLSGAGAIGQGGGFSALWGGSDMRLKENIKPVGKVGEFNFYTWDWNEDGEKVAEPDQPTFGVMAQEVEKTHPDLVMVGPDGFRRVNYGALYKQIGQ